MFFKILNILSTIFLLSNCVVENFTDYTSNAILQRSFKYKLDIKFEIPKTSFITVEPDAKLFFYPAYEVNHGVNKSSIRWIGLPCTYESTSIFKDITGTENVKGSFSCNVNDDEKYFNGIFYSKQCLESLHPDCYPKPNVFLLNINDHKYNTIKFNRIKCRIQYINHYKGTGEVNTFIAHGNSLETKFTKTEGQENRKPTILRLITTSSIIETYNKHSPAGISCNYDETNKKVNCNNSNITDPNESDKFLKFHQYNQTYENNIDVKYGLEIPKNDEEEIEYELTLDFQKNPSDNSSLLGEVFFVTVDKEGKHSIKMFGGIIEFKKSGEKILLKTKKLHYISNECLRLRIEEEKNNDQHFTKSCIPFPNLVKITFLQHNSDISKKISLNVFSLTVLSNVTNPSTGKKETYTWKGTYADNKVNYYKSYTFNKNVFTISMREDILDSEEIGDGATEKHVDYTLNSYIQKGVGYNVDVDIKLTLSSITSAINFFPAFSRKILKGDKVNNFLTWIGKPCTMTNTDKTSIPKNRNPNDIVSKQVKCTVEDAFEISKDEDKFNGMFYEPVCLKKLHKDCWMNTLHLLINFGNNNSINDYIYITSLNYSFTAFDLLNGKVITTYIGHKNWELNAKHGIKKHSKIGILRLYTGKNFISDPSKEELNCVYSRGDQRSSCNNGEVIEKESIMEKVGFQNLLVSNNDIQIYGYNKKHKTINYKYNNYYEVTFEFSKITQSTCKVFMEIFIVNFNESGKIMLELYGGIIELDQEKYFNKKGIIYLKTNQLNFVDKNCTNNNDCPPIGNAIKVTFMIGNNEKCDNLSLKYVKILTLLKGNLKNLNNAKTEHEIAFQDSQSIEFAKTYAIYTSNRNTSVILNVNRTWNFNSQNEELILVDPVDLKKIDKLETCPKSHIYSIIFYICLSIGLIETVVLIVVILLIIRGCKKSENGDDDDFDIQEKRSAKAKNEVADINIVDEENPSDGEEQKDVNKEEGKQHGNYNKSNYKELQGGEKAAYNEGGNYNNEERDGECEDDNNDGVDDNEGGKDKKQTKGKKQAPTKGVKKAGNKKTSQQKKTTPGGKKAASKIKGKKAAGGKKGTPRKVPPKGKVKPRPAPRGRRK
uniref:EGF-like domain-containing protein n=1 Tax=Strongyloides papillosus TaxID=174720 RepID=A0A0N5C932_STREA